MEEDHLLSYTRCDYPDGKEYPDKTSFAYVDQWAELYPQREAYVLRPSETEREAITFAEMKTASENVAIWLKREFNLQKGDRVGILSLNRLAYVICEFALSRLGVISVRLYVTTDSKEELTRSLKLTDCRLFLCQHVSLRSVLSILPDLESHDASLRLVSSELPKLEHVICMTGEASPGTRPLPDWRNVNVSRKEREELYNIQSGIRLDDDCSIYITSGSTGLPKFVVHSYRGVASFIPGVAHRCGVVGEDRYFTDRPMAYMGGNTSSVIILGATMVIACQRKPVTDNLFEYLLTIMKEERVTCGVSFPHMLYDIVESSDKELAEFGKLNIKFLLFGSQKTSTGVIRALKDCLSLGLPIVQTYCTTEMGEVCCNLPGDPFDVTARYPGRVLPGTEVKIVHDKTRRILPREEVGAIAIRKRHRWYYLNNEAKMRETHDDEGFFYQGDMARMSENGEIEIICREDDVISYGLMNCDITIPIEMMLCKHPAVDKVIVLSIPDPRMYEVIGAVVLPKPDAELSGEEIIEFFQNSVEENDLMTGLVYEPKYVWIQKSFPLTSSGKVNKKQLRRQCLADLTGAYQAGAFHAGTDERPPVEKETKRS